MKKDEFRSIAIDNRYRLTNAFNIFHLGTDSENAKSLLKIAKEYNFCDQSRAELSGRIFKKWAKSKEAPRWASDGAVTFLLETPYIPLTDNEKIALSLIIVELHSSKSFEEITKIMPPHLTSSLLIDTAISFRNISK